MAAVNGRFVRLGVSGMERYAREIVTRMDPATVRLVMPRRTLHGLGGQAWEQMVLPRRMNAHEVLWSPANTGPVGYHPQVVTVHDLAVFDHPEWFRRRVRLAYAGVVGRLIRDADLITTPSDFTRTRVIARFNVDRRRVRVVRGGVSSVWLWPAMEPMDRRGPTEALAKLEDTRFGLAVGGDDPRKNVGRLVKAWEAVRRVESDVDLVLLGSPARRVFVGSEMARATWIHHLGTVTDFELDSLYRKAAVLVYPSLYEGFGLPPLEALARGTPVVISDLPALRENVIGSGCFVDPWDSDSIATGVIRVLQATRSTSCLESGNVGTWEDAALDMADILDTVAGTRWV